jgi:hypothetical protein
MRKYPRTQHILGSRLQKGDDLGDVPIGDLKGKRLIFEEKMDGANSGVSFVDGSLKLQSRGHYLTGGPREKHFDLLKAWATVHALAFRDLLQDRYIMYGEWMWAKHTCFYDILPHYFMEFDILDTKENVFLSTEARQELIMSANCDKIISSVEVIGESTSTDNKVLEGLIKTSHFKSDSWKDSLVMSAAQAGVTPEDANKHTDPSNNMEGLYIKWEEDGIVKGRYKYVRQDFTNSILDQEQHWLDRPIICNVLAEGAYERMFAQ